MHVHVRNTAHTLWNSLLVWILPLGRINRVRRQREKGSWAVSEHLIHCMDQLIHSSAVPCDSIMSFKSGGVAAHKTGTAIQYSHKHRCVWDSSPLLERY